MTVASEITRLQGAKSDIRQAIIDKGVNVGAGLTLDEYATCIMAIESVKKGYIDVLVVGGGGGSGNGSSGSDRSGGGGGAVCVSSQTPIKEGQQYDIIVGRGGIYYENGAASCAFGICALGGYHGCFGNRANGGNSGNGHTSSGTGGAGAGGNATSANGGKGICSNISGSNIGYGGGGGACANGCGCDGGGNVNCNATGYGGGAGGGYNAWYCGYQGVVILRYKTDGSCGICNTSTGGCKYTCGDYTIHCFTNTGTTEQFVPMLK